jgi:hypothetical protein
LYPEVVGMPADRPERVPGAVPAQIHYTRHDGEGLQRMERFFDVRVEDLVSRTNRAGRSRRCQ